MSFELHIFHHLDAEQAGLWRDLFGKNINRKLETIMALIDDLKTKADTAIANTQKNTDLDASIVTMLTANAQQVVDLKTALAAAGTDPVKLQALSDTMDQLIAGQAAEIQKKADAITANTPAA